MFGYFGSKYFLPIFIIILCSLKKTDTQTVGNLSKTTYYCSSNCEPGCSGTLKERTCTKCCQTDNCNTGTVADVGALSCYVSERDADIDGGIGFGKSTLFSKGKQYCKVISLLIYLNR